MDETAEQTNAPADPSELWNNFTQLRHDGASGEWQLAGEDGQIASAPTLKADGAKISW